MDQPIDIADVARRTGLTPRALRFYEARGLVRPLRTASGRRIYGTGELERLARIVALKSAGFSLAQIGRLLAGQGVALGRLVEARIAALDAEAARVDGARRRLATIKSRIDRGEPLDAETLCSLIRHGDEAMNEQDWKAVANRYFDADEQARWAERMPAGFDQADYDRRWAELGQRVAAALPLDPASPAAQALYDEWQVLLAPFTAAATPEMTAGAGRLYDRMPEWQGDVQAPFGHEVWAFIKAAGAARR